MEYYKDMIKSFTTFILVVLLPLTAFSENDESTDKDLLISLQKELQTVLDWECSSNNPSQGKFINLKCELLSTSDN